MVTDWYTNENDCSRAVRDIDVFITRIDDQRIITGRKLDRLAKAESDLRDAIVSRRKNDPSRCRILKELILRTQDDMDSAEGREEDMCHLKRWCEELKHQVQMSGNMSIASDLFKLNHGAFDLATVIANAKNMNQATGLSLDIQNIVSTQLRGSNSKIKQSRNASYEGKSKDEQHQARLTKLDAELFGSDDSDAIYALEEAKGVAAAGGVGVNEEQELEKRLAKLQS